MLRRIPRAAWACAVIACLNAVCWSILVPPFQIPDEPDHFAYAKQIAEVGRLPSSALTSYSTDYEIVSVLSELRFYEVRQQPHIRTISSRVEQDGLEQRLAALRGEESAARGRGAAGTATSEPPLYYALEALPYGLGGNILTRLQLMRLLSALMAGLTALFAFMFVREALPAVPWAWSTGALAVALAPLFGFISGAVNPDSMLLAVSGSLFFGFARAFRRGLTRGPAAAIGVAVAVGMTTKLNFLGLLPGALLGLVLLTARAARTSGRSAYGPPLLACAIAAIPAALYAFVNVLSNHPALGWVSPVIGSTHLSLHEISYIWQLFLPPLPGMANDFPGLFTARQLWFDGYVGLYGWLDTTFPGWVYDVALIPAAAIAVLCMREIFARASALRSRLGELVVYAFMAIGVMALIGGASYVSFPSFGAGFAQTRYLLPMLPLLAAVLALAARGAGRRLGPAVGALIVVLFLAHDIFSQLQVVGRYYG